MKKIITLAVFLAVSGSVFAQNADRIQDTQAAKQSQSADVKKTDKTSQDNQASQRDALTHMEHAS